MITAGIPCPAHIVSSPGHLSRTGSIYHGMIAPAWLIQGIPVSRTGCISPLASGAGCPALAGLVIVWAML